MQENFTIGFRHLPGFKVFIRVTDNFAEPFRTGEYFAVFLAQKGACVLKSGSSVYPVNAPFLICANETEEIQFLNKSGLEGKIILFHPKAINQCFEFSNVRKGIEVFSNLTERQDLFFLNPFLLREPAYTGIFPLGPAITNRLTKLTADMERELTEQNHPQWPCRSRSIFFEILCAVNSILPEPDPIHEIRYIGEDSDLYPVLLYLHTRYQEKVTIEMLCEEFHTNRTSLQQKFSRITGKNIKEYLQDLRLRLSSMMLRDTTVPIQDIAERTGYGDLNQFSRMFRQKTGLTPSDYRQKTNWMLRSA